MRSAPRLLALAVLASFGAVTLSPCPPAADPDRAVRLAREAHPRAEASLPVISPPCPCGCEHQPAARGSFARLGFGLRSAPPEAPPPRPRVAPVAAEPAVPEAPVRPVDHVPLPASPFAFDSIV